MKTIIVQVTNKIGSATLFERQCEVAPSIVFPYQTIVDALTTLYNGLEVNIIFNIK